MPSTRSAQRSQEPSLDQLAGQRVIYAYSGTEPPVSLVRAIRAGEAGGVILFGDNVASPNQVRAVIGRLQQASLASPTHARLLVLVDQEGGEVRRLPGAPLLSEKQIGGSPNAVRLARTAGVSTGRELARAGVNVNLAPVLDVYGQAGDYIDQDQRSYSSAPAVVARVGSAFIASQEAAGVAATAKHFPGLGAATQAQDTDVRPVILPQSSAIVRSIGEAPYRAAISAGIKLVMLSWAIYPALDPHLPAGLSPTVIQQELRERLGFRGLTVTDSIDAGAVTPFGTLANRSVKAAAAGDDLILAATTNPEQNTPLLGVSVMHALASALATHRLSRAAALQTAHRILALRIRP
ncbi:MAG TPA: glycoside hydrolase family 3 N-terminal domain-containing protein [Solirubrobacteraceae bacterium]|nr:glycoside hydrolase family 3 N-terminal domain-containing protein [Solirubrobacteraceae bacterium]